MAPLTQIPGALVVGRSCIHGRGLFAGAVIPEGSLLGEYEGRARKWHPGTFVGNWTMRAGDELRDARLARCVLRFVNHGVPPNVRTEGFRFYAACRIEVGTEITMDYGHGW